MAAFINILFCKPCLIFIKSLHVINTAKDFLKVCKLGNSPLIII